MERSKFVPITEASTRRVTIALTLPPFLDSKHIGFDTRRTEHLMDLGAIKTLHITGMDEGVLGEEPVIVGVNSHGEAVAGKKGAKTSIPLYDRKREEGKHTPQDYGQVYINMDGIVRRLRDQKKWKEALRSVRGWSFYVDKAIREGLEEIGRENSMYPRKYEGRIAICLRATGEEIFSIPGLGPFLAEARYAKDKVEGIYKAQRLRQGIAHSTLVREILPQKS